jgi:hypothetical protein
MFKYLKRSSSKSVTESPNASVARLLNSLKGMGMAPRHIIDIGKK